jgi:hypothetical protein
LTIITYVYIISVIINFEVKKMKDQSEFERVFTSFYPGVRFVDATPINDPNVDDVKGPNVGAVSEEEPVLSFHIFGEGA